MRSMIKTAFSIFVEAFFFEERLFDFFAASFFFAVAMGISM